MSLVLNMKTADVSEPSQRRDGGGHEVIEAK